MFVLNQAKIQMDLYLITFLSELHKAASLTESHKDLFAEIERFFTLHLVTPQEMDRIPQGAYTIAFIASGGVERTVTQYFDRLPYPILLLCDGQHNSLAASLEIAAWLRSKGMKAQVVHGTPEHMVAQLVENHQAFTAQQALRGKRIGVVGHPSPWLVASNVDYLLAKRRWGVEFVDIPLEEVYCLFYQITDDEIGYAASVVANRAQTCLEGSPEELLKAMRLYRALQLLCEKKHLHALTLSCFTLIEKLHTTGCLALSLLNDEGIPAGCEGDLQSIFSMLVAQTLTGQPGFMANPTRLDQERNELVLAHCTVGTRMAQQFIIRDHFETRSGIAIQGLLPTGEVTLLKCAGECLDEYFVSTGELLENTQYEHACRTQIRLRLDKPVDYFTRSPLGNHHLLLLGNHEQAVNQLMQLNGCTRME